MHHSLEVTQPLSSSDYLYSLLMLCCKIWALTIEAEQHTRACQFFFERIMEYIWVHRFLSVKFTEKLWNIRIEISEFKNQNYRLLKLGSPSPSSHVDKLSPLQIFNFISLKVWAWIILENFFSSILSKSPVIYFSFQIKTCEIIFPWPTTLKLNLINTLFRYSHLVNNLFWVTNHYNPWMICHHWPGLTSEAICVTPRCWGFYRNALEIIDICIFSILLLWIYRRKYLF